MFTEQICCPEDHAPWQAGKQGCRMSERQTDRQRRGVHNHRWLERRALLAKKENCPTPCTQICRPPLNHSTNSMPSTTKRPCPSHDSNWACACLINMRALLSGLDKERSLPEAILMDQGHQPAKGGVLDPKGNTGKRLPNKVTS